MEKITNECLSAAILDVRPVLFTELPLPPTSNNQYSAIKRAGSVRFIPSSSLVKFKKDMDLWRMSTRNFLDGKYKIQSWIKSDHLLEVKAFYFFHFKTLFTKDNRVKKFDVSNRIKSCHDTIAQFLDVDDKFFFKISAEKSLCGNNFREMVCLEFSPIKNHIEDPAIGKIRETLARDTLG